MIDTQPHRTSARLFPAPYSLPSLPLARPDRKHQWQRRILFRQSPIAMAITEPLHLLGKSDNLPRAKRKLVQKLNPQSRSDQRVDDIGHPMLPGMFRHRIERRRVGIIGARFPSRSLRLMKIRKCRPQLRRAVLDILVLHEDPRNRMPIDQIKHATRLQVVGNDFPPPVTKSTPFREPRTPLRQFPRI
jgi:hypothetical protein